MKVEDVARFAMVADSPSLTTAAERLGVSQPTLSKSIARLERALGLPVIERRARGVGLTDAGRTFLAHAQPAALAVRDAVAAVQALRAGQAGTIRLGLGVGVPQALAVEALAPLIAGGGVSVEIAGGMSHSLAKAVAAGECDFAVTSEPPGRNASIRWEPVFPDPMVPVVTASHPLARARRVDWPLLSRQRWVTPGPGTSVRTWFEQQFVQRRVEVPRQVISMTDYSVTPDFGAALDAICLTPVSFMRANAGTRRFVEMRTPPDWASDRHVGVMQRRGGWTSPPARRLIERIREVGRERFG